MSAPEQIISDEDIIRVHGYANFGGMTPREVVNDGVRKYAVGFTGGHTQLCILLEHGLIRRPRPGKYRASLTEKGKRYARSIWKTHFCRADVCTPKDERVRALVEAVARGPIANEDMQGWIKTQMKAAQALRDMGATP